MPQKNNNTYSKPKFLIAFAITVAVLASLQAIFQFDVPPYPIVMEEAMGDTDIVDSLDYAEEVIEDELLAEQATTIPEDTRIEEKQDSVKEEEIAKADSINEQIDSTAIDSNVTQPIKNIRIGSHLWSYHDCFPDVQDVQIIAAQKNGVRPARSRDDVKKLVKRHKLVDITHSPYYIVDDLSHSMPYLVPKAQQLLNTISINFIDSLISKGMKPFLPVISSVLRSTDDVSRLQRGNRNATSNSCHCYGTTIDIAYHRFMPLDASIEELSNKDLVRWDDNLKFVLGEVLNDLRAQGKCYVKYERKQACFHLTVR
jgi:hypothetical protein